MIDLLKLAERCERAAEPDRRLDAQLEIATVPSKQWIVGEKPGRWPRDPVYGTLADLWEWAADESKEPPEINAPRYTASLDAAITLVPEDARPIEILHEAIDACGSAAQLFGGARDAVFTRRLPLFICAAALRSQAAIAMETGTATAPQSDVVAKP